MKTLKWIAVTALLAGSSTIALAQGPGIDSEGNVLPPQYNGPMTGPERGYYDYARPRHFNTARPETPYHYRYRSNGYR
jgi:hypothetical protein